MLAKELRVPVIVVDQLDQTEDLGDAYPLSEHADIVMFLDHAKVKKFCSVNWNMMEVHVVKFRQGPTGGTLQLAFGPQWMTFLQLADNSSSSADETASESDFK